MSVFIYVASNETQSITKEIPITIIKPISKFDNEPKSPELVIERTSNPESTANNKNLLIIILPAVLGVLLVLLIVVGIIIYIRKRNQDENKKDSDIEMPEVEETVISSNYFKTKISTEVTMDNPLYSENHNDDEPDPFGQDFSETEDVCIIIEY